MREKELEIISAYLWSITVRDEMFPVLFGVTANAVLRGVKGCLGSIEGRSAPLLLLRLPYGWPRDDARG